MVFHDAVDDGEAQPGSLSRAFGGEEGFGGFDCSFPAPAFNVPLLSLCHFLTTSNR